VKSLDVARFGLIALLISPVFAQTPAAPATPAPAPAAVRRPPIRSRNGRAVRSREIQGNHQGLTQFGIAARHGSQQATLDWIEAQLKSYGYTNTARIKYDYFPTDPRRPSGPLARGAGGAQGGGVIRGNRVPVGVNMDPLKQPDEKLRALNMQASAPGPREDVYCTKIGTTHPRKCITSVRTWTATAGRGRQR